MRIDFARIVTDMPLMLEDAEGVAFGVVALTKPSGTPDNGGKHGRQEM